MSTPHPEFDRALQWLNARITNLTGARYAIPRTPAERQHEFEAKITRMTAFLAFAGNPLVDQALQRTKHQRSRPVAGSIMEAGQRIAS